MDKIGVGDFVRSKTDGQYMLVIDVLDDSHVECIWPNNSGKWDSLVLHPETIEKSE